MSTARRMGKYEVQALLGEGPGSAVHRGYDGQSAVALKFIERSPAQATALARLRATAAALAAYDIPGIAPPLDFMQTEKETCIVSRLAPGEPLSARLKSGIPDLKLAWDVARQLLDTLGLVHSAGVVHGNLKPTNLFLDAQGKVCIADFATFGLRRAQEAPIYAAPEQVSGAEPTVRTDLYQVGAIMYQLVVGKPPFSGSVAEVEHLVAQERPADPSTFNPKLAWQLDWVLQRALSKDSADRFGGAREMIEGLRLAMQEAMGTSLTLTAPSRLVVAKTQERRAVAPPPAAAPATPATPAAASPPTSPATAANRMLDAAAAMRAAQANPAAAPPPTNLMRVLIVDDEERILNGLRALFHNTFEVHTANSAVEALKLLEQHVFHIVVSDQRMPGMTGVELLREVKNKYPRTVRLLLTGYTDLTALVGSINEGEVFRYIKKPWDNDEVRAVMDDAAALVAKFMPAPARPKAPRSAGSLMVIDPGKGLALGLERLVAGAASVHRVASAREAAKILQTQDVAAVVADLKAGKDGLIALFKLLKAKRPETLSILVADEADAELVADLINHAQVFKFLARPVKAREMRAHVGEALRRYAAFKEARRGGSGLAEHAGPGGLATNAA